MNFTVYSKSGCPYCVKVKEVLGRLGYSDTTYTLGSDFTREGFYSIFGEGTTFPQVLCDGKNLGGCVDTIKYLRENELV